MSSVWGSIVLDHERTAGAAMGKDKRTRTCVRCKQTMPVSAFYQRSNRSPDSYHWLCRECMKQYNKERALKKKGK